MRAAIIVTDTRRGGTPLRLASLARHMNTRGWEILFVSLLPGGSVLEDLRTQGITTKSLYVTSSLGGPMALWKLRRLLSGWRPNIIQTALWHANILGRLATVGTGMPVVSGYQSMDEDKSALRVRLDRLTHRLAAAHACVSDAVARRLEERERIDRSKITVIHAGKRVEEWLTKGRREVVRSQLGIPSDAKVVGWVGRIHPVKDLPTLARAIASLDDWWLLVVGDGPEAKRIRKCGDELGLGTRLVMAGETRHIAPLLEVMDVFCLVSLWEGFPGALVEAMAAGLPVVAADVGGVPEIVIHGENGLLVPSGDQGAIASAVLEAAGSPELGRRATETVRERFSEQRMIERYEELWRQLAR